MKPARNYSAVQQCALPNCGEYNEFQEDQVNAFEGIYGNYPEGEGFTADFNYGMDYKTVVDRLRANKWVDANSRALLLRWTVYNFWVKRYLYVEATLEIPDKRHIHNTFYINSISLISLDNGVQIFSIVVLAINVFIFIGKIVFEMSIGLSIVTNLLEAVNCIIIVAMLISKMIEFSYEATYNESEFDNNRYIDFSDLEGTTAANNSLAILASLFIPFRFFTLCSHFKFFNPFATLIKVYFRMLGELLVFVGIAL